MLFRIMLVVGLAVLLLPTDERKQAEVYSTARYALERTVTFCDRNPGVCESGREFWAVFVRKAEFGVDLVAKLARSRSDGGEPASVSAVPVASEPVPALEKPGASDRVRPVAVPPVTAPVRQSSPTRGTLSSADTQPQWRGPALARSN
jgi:hypothetical protein